MRQGASVRFQFSLRTLLIVVTLVAVNLAALPLFTVPLAFVGGPMVKTEYKEEGGNPIYEQSGTYPDAKWRMAVLAVDASLIGLAIWLALRKSDSRPPRS
jgi:hypothetical protein